MLNQVFFSRFEPVRTRFGLCKISKCLENGPFWDQKGVKNGSKTRFSKSDPRPFSNLKQVFSAHFEPVVMRFHPWNIPKCLKKGLFLVPKMGEKRVENAFSKNCSWTIEDIQTSEMSPF